MGLRLSVLRTVVGPQNVTLFDILAYDQKYKWKPHLCSLERIPRLTFFYLQLSCPSLYFFYNHSNTEE
eukprot:UN16971